jgi:CheY-like chemotaxis protein
MGGRIWVTSEVDRGSTFSFTATFEVAASPEHPRRDGGDESVPAPLRVLLADDHPAGLALTARLLQGWGHRVHVARDGRETVEIARREPLDLVLLDFSMPGMGGAEAARLIRESEGGGRRVPIYGLTAHLAEDERDRCLAAGMDGIFGKPIDLDRLRETLRRLAEGLPPELA